MFRSLCCQRFREGEGLVEGSSLWSEAFAEESRVDVRILRQSFRSRTVGWAFGARNKQHRIKVNDCSMC
jgi:hypothetical protein